MTKNIERWEYWLKDFGSPHQFKVWGFYSMVSSVLQRRVFLGSRQKPLFGNMFTILTGPAGVGKGMILGEVGGILRHPKLKKQAELEENREKIKQELADAEIVIKPKQDTQVMNNEINARIKNMLVPMAPNATTFEALVNVIGQCNASLRYVDDDGNKRVEQHSSITVHLEELGSLFRKHTEDIHTLVCELYDCKDPYEYRTKHQGTDFIRRPCINILAGTTPDFLKRVFSSSLLTEGFASRTVFVVAMKNAFRRFETPVFSKEQILEREVIIDHVLKLTKIGGKASFTPEALQYCKEMWEDENFDANRRNPHPKMNHYYARKNITLAKLAMAIHFSDSLEMTIPLEAVILANTILEQTEESMHLALASAAKNPLMEATEGIQKYISVHKSASRKSLKAVFYEQLPNPDDDLSTILSFLIEQGKIKEDSRPNYYTHIEEEKQ